MTIKFQLWVWNLWWSNTLLAKSMTKCSTYYFPSFGYHIMINKDADTTAATMEHTNKTRYLISLYFMNWKLCFLYKFLSGPEQQASLTKSPLVSIAPITTHHWWWILKILVMSVNKQTTKLTNHHQHLAAHTFSN